jgi:hypothetical protein
MQLGCRVTCRKAGDAAGNPTLPVFVFSTKMERNYILPGILPVVDQRVTQTIDVWNSCAGKSLPPFPRFAPREQGKREQAYDRGLRSVESVARSAPRTEGDHLLARQRLVGTFPPFAAVALGLKPDAVDLLMGVFLRTGTELTQWARSFDPGLTVPDTIQACRNAWTACGLQALVGEPMQLTTPIAAYSMLYPYSDNYLDHPSRTRAEKLAFSERFRRRLSGEQLDTTDNLEAAVWAMVELIERHYPRLSFPQVFDSLLAIHRAQEASIAQLGGLCDTPNSINGHDLLRVSCAKGGTSVLADAFLAQPWLTEEESQFAFEWGVLLQLGDDLQDVNEDLRRGSATLFTDAVSAGQPLDQLVMQLLNFSQYLGERMDVLPHGSQMLKDLLRMSWRSLILMAVAESQPFFTREFLARLEPLSAFRFEFLRKRNGNLVAREALYVRLFDAFVASSPNSSVALSMPMVVAKAPSQPEAPLPGFEFGSGRQDTCCAGCAAR